MSTFEDRESINANQGQEISTNKALSLFKAGNLQEMFNCCLEHILNRSAAEIEFNLLRNLPAMNIEASVKAYAAYLINNKNQQNQLHTTLIRKKTPELLIFKLSYVTNRY